MEAIQQSLFVEKFGEEPSGYIPFEQMMKKEKIEPKSQNRMQLNSVRFSNAGKLWISFPSR